MYNLLIVDDEAIAVRAIERGGSHRLFGGTIAKRQFGHNRRDRR